MPVAGQAETIMPSLQRVLAPNPSPMTYWGTNTYILGDHDVVVIDPGPNDESHLVALVRILAGRRVDRILVTHSHLDHSGLAGALSTKTNAPVIAFGDSGAGRSTIMTDLIAGGLTTGGEGVDHGFQPDKYLGDGAMISGSWGKIEAIHTPGHMANHLCFRWGDVVFTGDHVMGWASSLISPPDGDLTEFMKSCHRLTEISAKLFLPGHGGTVDDPTDRLRWLIEHRYAREAQILSVLSRSTLTISEITDSLYRDLAPGLRRVAQRNIFAHLIDLVQRQKIAADPGINFDAKYYIIGTSDG